MLSQLKDSDKHSINLNSHVMLPENQSNCTKLQAPSRIPLELAKSTRSRSQFQPENVSKMFSSDVGYSVAPTEPVKRVFKIFLNAANYVGWMWKREL